MFLTSAIQKDLFFLIRLRVGLSHLREQNFKHIFLDTIISICNCTFDIGSLNHFFLHWRKFTNERASA